MPRWHVLERLDSSGLALESRNCNFGQRWSLSTSCPHIRDPSFAIIILADVRVPLVNPGLLITQSSSERQRSLDVAALAGNNSSPGLYTCGGFPGGVGYVSVNQVDSRRDGVFVFIDCSRVWPLQAFTYSTLKDSRGPFIFVPLSGWIPLARHPRSAQGRCEL